MQLDTVAVRGVRWFWMEELTSWWPNLLFRLGGSGGTLPQHIFAQFLSIPRQISKWTHTILVAKKGGSFIPPYPPASYASVADTNRCTPKVYKISQRKLAYNAETAKNAIIFSQKFPAIWYATYTNTRRSVQDM